MPRTTTTEYAQAKARAPGADFADYCCELLGSLGEVRAKRMFLGYGLSVEDLTVAVIAWDTLYLKTNTETQAKFAAAGSQVFEHVAKGRTRRMQYHTAPESALESPASMQPWAGLAMNAALAARKPIETVKRSGSGNAVVETRASKSINSNRR